MEAVSKHNARKEEKAMAKEEEKKFRKMVEKERAACEKLEKEKTLEELEENKSIGSYDTDKTLVSATHTWHTQSVVISPEPRIV